MKKKMAAFLACTMALSLSACGGNGGKEEKTENAVAKEETVAAESVEEKKEEKASLKNLSVGDRVFFGTYEQDNNWDNGSEPIEWIVANTENVSDYVVLISRYGLDIQPYHTEDADVTWENCSLRKWLNDDFLYEAFGIEDRATISPVNLQNPENPYYHIAGGNDTLDTVWLFNVQDSTYNLEILKENMGQVETTEYVQNKGAEKVDSWWLRAPGSGADKAAVAYDQSNFGKVDSPVEEYQIIRPAILIPIDKELTVSWRDKEVESETKASSKTTTSQTTSSSSFTNKYGTSTTKCAQSGCNNYIASSGDTNCCITHSNRCGECNCYIDGDAMFCMSCISSSVKDSGSSNNSSSSYSKKSSGSSSGSSSGGCQYKYSDGSTCGAACTDYPSMCNSHMNQLNDIYDSLTN